MKACVYLITNQITNKIYVGKSCELEKRWLRHKQVAMGGKEKYPTSFSLIHKAMNKYGFDNFSFKIIEFCETENDALSKEKFWISMLKQDGYVLYNLTDGGEGSSGFKHSKESIEKMKECNLGSNNPRFGTKHKTESIDKIITARHKLNLNAKQSQRVKGINNPRAKLTIEDINKINILLSEGVYQKIIAKMFKVSQSTISKVKLGYSG